MSIVHKIFLNYLNFDKKIQIQHLCHIRTSTKIYMLSVLLMSLSYNCLNFRFAHIGYIHDLL